MAACNSVEVIQINRQIAHANMPVAEGHYAHSHPGLYWATEQLSLSSVTEFSKTVVSSKMGRKTKVKCRYSLK